MIHVEVTAEQIATKNHSAFNCPIVQAAKAVTEDEFETISVTGAAITFYDWDGEHYKYITLPVPIQTWLGAYDGSEFVEPFSFDIDLAYLDIINIKGI